MLNPDMFPSVLGLLKIKPPAEGSAQRAGFHTAVGAHDANWRTEIFGQYALHNSGLAYMPMLRTNDWKLVRYYPSNGLDELYDLKNDRCQNRWLVRRTNRPKCRSSIPTDWARKLRVWLVGFGLQSNRDVRR